MGETLLPTRMQREEAETRHREAETRHREAEARARHIAARERNAAQVRVRELQALLSKLTKTEFGSLRKLRCPGVGQFDASSAERCQGMKCSQCLGFLAVTERLVDFLASTAANLTRRAPLIPATAVLNGTPSPYLRTE